MGEEATIAVNMKRCCKLGKKCMEGRAEKGIQMNCEVTKTGRK